jgi:hypothetical protein
VFFDLPFVTRGAATGCIGIQQQDGFRFTLGAWLHRVAHCVMRVVVRVIGYSVGYSVGRVGSFHRAQFNL